MSVESKDEVPVPSPSSVGCSAACCSHFDTAAYTATAATFALLKFKCTFDRVLHSATADVG